MFMENKRARHSDMGFSGDDGWFGNNNCLCIILKIAGGSSNEAPVIKKSENGDFPAKIESCQSCVYRSDEIRSTRWGRIGPTFTEKIIKYGVQVGKGFEFGGRICGRRRVADGLHYLFCFFLNRNPFPRPRPKILP